MLTKLVSYIAASVLFASVAGAAPQPADGGTRPSSTCLQERLDRLLTLAFEGDAASQFRIGVIFQQGLCGVADAARSAHWLSTAADNGHSEAAFQMGQMYRDGDGVEADLAVAARYFRLAAEQDNRDAQHHLGLVLLWLAETEDDRYEALYWLGAAANAGDGFSAASLGILHARGIHGVKEDICLALDWLETSSLLGFTDLEEDMKAFRLAHENMCN